MENKLAEVINIDWVIYLAKLLLPMAWAQKEEMRVFQLMQPCYWKKIK